MSIRLLKTSTSLTRITALTLFAVAITLLATVAIPNRLAAKPPHEPAMGRSATNPDEAQ